VLVWGSFSMLLGIAVSDGVVLVLDWVPMVLGIAVQAFLCVRFGSGFRCCCVCLFNKEFVLVLGWFPMLLGIAV
jgi:hypothetical protein